MPCVDDVSIMLPLVSTLRDTHDTEVSQFNAVIRQHRDIIKNKDVEFLNLMDLKVALGMEIKV